MRSGQDRTSDEGALERTAAVPVPPAERRARAWDAVEARFPDAESTLRSRLGAALSDPATDATVALDDYYRDSGPSLPRPPQVAPPLEPFGPYSKIEVLPEQGSIGVVARGYNDSFARWELLKLLRPEYAADVELVRQFKREGRVLARLSHPHVVQVFAMHDVRGQTCLAMEYLHGQSLKAAVVERDGQVSLEQGQQWLLEAARGLAASHEAGLLHRDIKPENLFVTATGRGRAGGLKLIDFGLATADRGRTSLAQDPALVSATLGGTPLFMAPELWLGHESTPRSDLFALGVTFYFVFAGALPYPEISPESVKRQLLRVDPFPSVRTVRSDLPPAIAAIIDRLMSKSAADRFASADELVAAVVTATAASRQRKVPGAGPYPGLEPFTATERDVFFGRDAEIAEVVERLREQSAVVLVGPSGSGKSSLAMAGVAGAIEDGVLGGGRVFGTLCLQPRARPMRRLASALAPLIGAHEGDPVRILEAEPAELGRRLRTALGESRGLLVVLDQLEEVTTLATQSSETGAFTAAVASLVDTPSDNVRVVATLRADLMDRLFAFESLRSLLTRGFYPVRPLTGEPLRQALLGPAEAAGYALEEPQIADEIIRDVTSTRAGLPLMSFAMSTWWQARDEQRHVLPAAAWRDLGGLGGALARHADAVLDALSPDERTSAGQILVRLVTPERTRAVASRAELEDPAATGAAGVRALDRLLSAKLVLASADEVELVHESLIERWPTLQKLLQSAGQDRIFRGQVAASAEQWQAQNRADGALWDGEQAARLLRWFDTTEAPLGQHELAFIEAVRKRNLRRRFLRRSLIAAVVLAAMTVALYFKASERRLATRLDHARAAASVAEQTYGKEIQHLFKQTAELQLDQSPAEALRSALRARALGEDPDLDLIAWRAQLAGIPRALPLHPGGARLVRFCPKGGRIATAGERAEVRLVSVRTEQVSVVPLPQGAAAPLGAMEFSATGQWLALGGADGQVALHQRAQRTMQVLGRCDGPVHDLVWSGDERVTAICGAAPAVRVVSFTTKPGSGTDLVTGPTLAAALSPTVSHVAQITAAGELRLLDARTGAELAARRMEGEPATALGVAASAATVLVGGADGGLATLSISESGKLGKPRALLSPHLAAVRHISVSPDGRHWVTIDEKKRAALWNTRLESVGTLRVGRPLVRWIGARRTVALLGPEFDILLASADTGAYLGRLAGATQRLTDLSASRGGRWLAATSGDGGVRAWELDSATAKVLHAPQPAGSTCAVSSEGEVRGCLGARLFSASGQSDADFKAQSAHQLTVPEASDSQARAHLAVAARGKSAAWQQGARSIVRVVSEQVSVIDVAADPKRLAFDHAGQVLALVGQADAGAPLLALLRAGAAQRDLPVPAAVTALVFSEDDSRLLVGATDGRVHLFDVADGKLLGASSTTGSGPVAAVALAREGTLAAASSKGEVVVMSALGKAPEPIYSASSDVVCLAFSRRSHAVVVGTADGALTLVDVGTRAVLPLLRVSAGLATCGRRPNDDIFVVTAQDGSVWQRALSLQPIWMVKPPDDPLDPATASLDSWRGLDPEDQR